MLGWTTEIVLTFNLRGPNPQKFPTIKEFQYNKHSNYRWNDSQTHSISEGLFLKFSAIRKLLYSVDLKCCDVVLKLLSNSISEGLILKVFPGQASKSHISTKFTRWSLHTKITQICQLYARSTHLKFFLGSINSLSGHGCLIYLSFQ